MHRRSQVYQIGRIDFSVDGRITTGAWFGVRYLDEFTTVFIVTAQTTFLVTTLILCQCTPRKAPDLSFTYMKSQMELE